MSAHDLELLDTTLRDGSYVIDFQFTAEDTALIASTLESAGVTLIEIAHGLGLGAARGGKGDQAATDEAYLRAAASALKSARFGAFFIPGIGTEDDLRLAADCGAHFIRIGTNVTDLAEAEPFVNRAKALGLTVSSNLMKSYAVPPGEFGKCGRIAQELGADVLCLVDSAGGMLPEEVREYLEAASAVCGLRLGFHGHNNLSMAVANTLEAVRSGATIVDASLQGMGRSEGNAVTEIVAAILQKQGLLMNIDVNALLDASEAFIRPLLHNTGYSGLGITSGRAKFHSSFLARVLASAGEFGVDARDLILKVCEHDQINAPQVLVDRLARELAEQGPKTRARFSFPANSIARDGGIESQVAERALEIREHGRKRQLPAVLNVVVSPHEETHVSPFVETGFGCAISNVMLRDAQRLSEVITIADGIVDYFLIDPKGHGVSTSKSDILVYSDDEMWVRAAVTHVTRLLGGSLTGKVIAVAGVEPLAELAINLFKLHGATLQISDADTRCDALVALSPRRPCVTAAAVDQLRNDVLLFDGGIGSLGEEAIEAARVRGITVVRIDMRPTLAATVLELINMKRIAEESMGRDTWDGVTVVAGGVIGAKGEVIVDNITRPARIVGIADGRGGIVAANESDDAVRTVRKSIAAKRLRGQ